MDLKFQLPTLYGLCSCIVRGEAARAITGIGTFSLFTIKVNLEEKKLLLYRSKGDDFFNSVKGNSTDN